MENIYDVIIIGGGPGGYTAALYCARAGMTTTVIEKLSAGGQMATTSQIENYPGFAEAVDGFDLAEQMQAGAEKFGAESIMAEALSVNLKDEIKTVVTDDGVYKGKTVIIATGASPKTLGLDKEESLINKGIAYCATCDGMMFKGKTTVVIGGGNSAVADALFLSKICTKIYLVHRRDSLRATKVYMNALSKAENLEIIWNSKPVKLLSDKKITGIELENTKTGEKQTLNTDGVFIAIGRKPNTEFLNGVLELDKNGYIIADETTQTNISGVFAVGDVRTKEMRQIVTATADGATASKYIEDYLAEHY